MRISFLLNWYLNPYHAPIIVAKEMGFYEQEGIELSIIEPTNPSDVTKIIGKGEISLGLKAMVHCYAARDRGYPITSIGTLLDEPPTGLISLKKKSIQSVQDFKGKRLGYVGEFGKVMIDHLAQQANLSQDEYTTHRIGMDAAEAILSDRVDAAIGLSCFQQIEIEQAGFESSLLRIDRLAHLGCCCFCSIMIIAHEQYVTQKKEALTSFMKATLQGMNMTREMPQQAYECLIKTKAYFKKPPFEKIFQTTLPFFAKDMKNVARDWEKVGQYAKQLDIAKNLKHTDLYTNDFLPQKELQHVF